MSKTIGVVLALKDKCSPIITNVAKKFGIADDQAKKLNATLRQQAKNIDDKLTPVIGKLNNALGIGAISSIAGLTAMGKACVTMASDYNETMGK